MPNKRFGSIQGLAMRATNLDGCGQWTDGPCQTTYSDGFVSVDISANIDEGEEFEVKTAAGTLCINEKECPVLKWFDLEIEFCNTDPEFFTAIASSDLVIDAAGDSVGYQIGETRDCSNFSLEIWTKVAGAACGASECGPNVAERWIYWLFPWLTNGILGGFTIENGPLSTTWNGNSKANPNWGQGPYNVICTDEPFDPAEGCQVPGPLFDTPVLATTHLYKRLTPVAPPTVECGCQELEAVAPIAA